MKKAILGMALTLVCTASGAAFMTGNALYDECTSAKQIEQLSCISYIQGAIDMASGGEFCPPGRLSGKQAVDIFVQVLRDAPSVRHLNADTLLIKIFGDLYPCERKPTAGRQPV